MSHAIPRVCLGPVQNPVRGLLHGSAALAAATLAVPLWRHASCDASGRLALLVFALSQSALFATSALYHSAPWSPRWKVRMQRLDHSAIFVKIAGTLTPILWLGADDGQRGVLLLAAWSAAALGVARKLCEPRVCPRGTLPLMVGQACLVLPALGPFAQRFPQAAVQLLAATAVLYLLGLAIFVTERPRLWPGIFSHHELFHVVTVLGSGAHYALALQYLAAAR